jgi:uncharacterized protein (TIGR02145 family)
MKTTHRISSHFFCILTLLLTSCLPKVTTNTENNETVTDMDGNVYQTVTIGTQTWMKENLRTNHYRNGDAIPNVADDNEWTTGVWCDYNNDAANGKKYGHLYNWYAVSDSRNIAPEGWHVATDTEWTTLTEYVSAHLGKSPNQAKALAASTDWTAPSYEVDIIGWDLTLNNSTGFSALPCGYRDVVFYDIGYSCHWWSSTKLGTGTARERYINNRNDLIRRTVGGNSNGYYVRCVKD